MMKALRRPLFWAPSVLGLLTAALFVYTSFIPDWIETVFGVDPDAGNGSAERTVVLALVAITVVAFSVASIQIGRASANAAAA